MNTRTVVIDDIAVSVALARKRMTKKQLGEISEINQGSLSTILKRGTVRPKTAKKIAEALGVDVTEIMKQPEE